MNSSFGCPFGGYGARFVSVLKPEVCSAALASNPRAATLDAHAGSAEAFPIFREGTWSVLQTDRDVMHRLAS
jgi:hypothetical protein